MTTRTTSNRRRASGGTAPRGFTLIETLVVIVIIALLLGIVGVALNRSVAGGRRAATEQLLRSIALGLEQFKQDFGYYPPLIDDEKRAMEAVLPDPADALLENRFHSIYSLPLYLIGVGELAPETYRPGEEDLESRHDGVSGPGFRDPGADRSWGGAADRMMHSPTRTGRTYGPYIDVGSGRNFRQVTIDDPRRPEIMFEEVEGLYTFEDRWGTPIRYYRHWPTREVALSGARTQSLNRVPIELIQRSTIEAKRLNTDLDATLERDLLNAPFALLSAGPDGEFAIADFLIDSQGDPVLLDDSFSNSESVEPLRPELMSDGVAWKTLLDSIGDNVRALP